MWIQWSLLSFFPCMLILSQFREKHPVVLLSFQNLPFFVYQEPLLTTLSFAAHGQIQLWSRISSLYTQCFEILLNFKHLGWWVERGRWWKPSLAWASGSFQPCLQLPIWHTDIIFVHWTWFGAVSAIIKWMGSIVWHCRGVIKSRWFLVMALQDLGNNK